MYMRLLFNTFLLMMLIAVTAQGQKFKPGYYIESSGDTVKHDIAIQKKNGKIDKVVTPEGLFLAAKDLSGFGLDGVTYVVKSVSVDISPYGGVITDTLFLEVMNREKMSLSYTIDEHDKVHFYIENELGLQELTVKIISNMELVTQTRVEVFRARLKAIFPTCTDLFPQIDRTVFGRKGIRSIYDKLYLCRYNEAPTFKETKSDKETVLGVLAGATSTSGDFPSVRGSLVSFLTFHKSVDPTAGLFAETRISRGSTFAMRHELTYYQYSFTSDPYKQTQFSANTFTAYISTKYVKYAFIARMYFLQGKFKPFINVAVSPAYALSVKHTMTTVGGPNGGVEPLFQRYARFEYGYIAGIGAMYDRFQGDVRYEWSSGLRARDADSKIVSAYIMLSYRLNK